MCCPTPHALTGAFTSGYIERTSFEEVTGGSWVADDHFSEAERKAQEEAERKASEEAERKARAEQEAQMRRAREEAERKRAAAARKREEAEARKGEPLPEIMPPAPPPQAAPAKAGGDGLDALMADLDSFTQREDEDRKSREEAVNRTEEARQRSLQEEGEQRAREQAERERRDAEARQREAQERREQEQRAREQAEQRARDEADRQRREAERAVQVLTGDNLSVAKEGVPECPRCHSHRITRAFPKKIEDTFVIVFFGIFLPDRKVNVCTDCGFEF